jgi:hypothetical protein
MLFSQHIDKKQMYLVIIMIFINIIFILAFLHIDNPGGPPHGSVFEITFRHTALGRTPLDE